MPSRFGQPAHTLGAAVEAMRAAGLAVARVSRFYHTPCFPAGAGPDYVNAVVVLDAADDPAALLAVLHAIEADFGRERRQRWGMRCLDLDLIAAGDAVLPDRADYEYWRDLAPEGQRRKAPDRLILPHPRMQDRAFVLVPLCELLPDWRHPVSGQSAAQMLAALPPTECAAVRPIGAVTGVAG